EDDELVRGTGKPAHAVARFVEIRHSARTVDDEHSSYTSTAGEHRTGDSDSDQRKCSGAEQQKQNVAQRERSSSRLNWPAWNEAPRRKWFGDGPASRDEMKCDRRDDCRRGKSERRRNQPAHRSSPDCSTIRRTACAAGSPVTTSRYVAPDARHARAISARQ